MNQYCISTVYELQTVWAELTVSSAPVPIKLTTYCLHFIFLSIVHAIRNRIRSNLAVMKQRLLPGDIQWKCPSGMFEGEVIKHQAPHRDLRWIRILKKQ